MENISKVLIIVAAVLIALLIISVSVFIFNIVKDPVAQAADNMTSEERIFFNSKFQRYESGRVSGIETKGLVNIYLQNVNQQLNLGERARIPEFSITFNDEQSSLNRDDINSKTDKDFKNYLQSILNKINMTSFFSIEVNLNSNNGIVSEVIIKELNN